MKCVTAAAAVTLLPMSIAVTIAVTDLEASRRFYAAIGADLSIDDGGGCPDAAPYYEGWLGGCGITLCPAVDGAATRGLELEVTVDCVLTVVGSFLAEGIANTLDIGGLIQCKDPDGNTVHVMEKRRRRTR